MPNQKAIVVRLNFVGQTIVVDVDRTHVIIYKIEPIFFLLCVQFLQFDRSWTFTSFVFFSFVHRAILLAAPFHMSSSEWMRCWMTFTIHFFTFLSYTFLAHSRKTQFFGRENYSEQSEFGAEDNPIVHFHLLPSDDRAIYFVAFINKYIWALVNVMDDTDLLRSIHELFHRQAYDRSWMIFPEPLIQWMKRKQIVRKYLFFVAFFFFKLNYRSPSTPQTPNNSIVIIIHVLTI